MNDHPSAERQGRASAQGRTGVQVGRSVEPDFLAIPSLLSACIDAEIEAEQRRTGESAEVVRARLREEQLEAIRGWLVGRQEAIR